MPLSIAIDSNIALAQLFIAHWTQVNAALGAPANELKLTGGYTLANFTSDRDAFQTLINAVIAAENAAQIARTNRDNAKNGIAPRVTQFRASVEYAAAGSGYLGGLPTTPKRDAVEGRFVGALQDMLNVWTQVNADTTIAGFTPPLVLPGGVTLAAFTTELAGLRTKFDAVNTAENNLKTARRNRDNALAALRRRMVQYRIAVPAKLGLTAPLTLSMPAYSPTDTGPAADQVSAAGTWNATTHEAVLTWDQSTLPANVFGQYQVRTAPGPTYRVKDEETISDGLDAVYMTTFSTNAGLTVAGATALFRVYVVTSSGREKGSATVSVTRP